MTVGAEREGCGRWQLGGITSNGYNGLCSSRDIFKLDKWPQQLRLVVCKYYWCLYRGDGELGRGFLSIGCQVSIGAYNMRLLMRLSPIVQYIVTYCPQNLLDEPTNGN